MKIKYFMSHGSPWTFLGHKKVNEISKKYNCDLDIMPVNYGEIFPISGGLPVHKRPLQRQKYRLQELKRWSEFLKIKLNSEPKHFPSRTLLPSKVIISVKILNFKNVNDIAYAIMEGLWIKEMNIDDPQNLKKILTRFIKTADEVIEFNLRHAARLFRPRSHTSCIRASLALLLVCCYIELRLARLSSC